MLCSWWVLQPQKLLVEASLKHICYSKHFTANYLWLRTTLILNIGVLCLPRSPYLLFTTYFGVHRMRINGSTVEDLVVGSYGYSALDYHYEWVYMMRMFACVHIHLNTAADFILDVQNQQLEKNVLMLVARQLDGEYLFQIPPELQSFSVGMHCFSVSVQRQWENVYGVLTCSVAMLRYKDVCLCCGQDMIITVIECKIYGPRIVW